MTYKARQGDIVTLDFHPQKGHEQSGRRPAVIVSNDFFNKLSSLSLVCPISNSKSDFPLNVNLDDRTNTTGAILCQHIKSLDLAARNAVFVEKLPDDVMKEIKEIIVSEF
ncbi:MULTISPECIES: type II toxin-antitoxin system PemK/MazF family toxin [Bacillaceae]|uniref:Toxin MazF n=1 Tax=Domibacillus aminovorans TaxID=29332 RepID=A0A177KN57_9BACI|nr:MULTISPECIES: type II toxin-antitoxin system PemK/MazF family toxin [Bacillaceae]OAH54803.1 toxin MazF [Domibacillus aminovorans]